MANNEVKMNGVEVRAVAKKFISAVDKCDKIQQRLKSASDEALTSWKGDSKKAFKKEYDLLYKNMFNYKDILKCIAEDLEKAATGFEKTDEDLKNGILKSQTAK